jgi:hypothetical protein
MQVQHERSQLGLRLNFLEIFTAQNYSSRDDGECCAGLRQPSKLQVVSPTPDFSHSLTRGPSELSGGVRGSEDGSGAAPSGHPGGPL